MADWYRYADNRKKIVGFCAYVVRSSLAKLYAARYRLKSRAKVYKIASRDLSRPLTESTRNDAPEYSDLLRMGLVDAIEGVQFSRMSSIPSCDYTPLPRNWVPHHELVLREYIKLQDPKFFCELLKTVKRQELISPQEDISKMVWSHKIHGILSKKSSRTLKEKGKSDDTSYADKIYLLGKLECMKVRMKYDTTIPWYLMIFDGKMKHHLRTLDERQNFLPHGVDTLTTTTKSTVHSIASLQELALSSRF
ncbi:putative mitochondrial protein ymf11 [Ananas comosus]|uniref:Putative mitochondrial protein ymf11 n=1 Tax=Ananas comosus TaxID=4615 RepID=A0A199W8M0_ANACO|nr:putative mitochondrial protein ymf11 [Ananas comosus]